MQRYSVPFFVGTAHATEAQLAKGALLGSIPSLMTMVRALSALHDNTRNGRLTGAVYWLGHGGLPLVGYPFKAFHELLV